MIIRIHKGDHWPGLITRIRQAGILLQPWMERDVVFGETAAYDLGGTDDDDVNKLFGFGYINGAHHKDSARFGWNYNDSNGRIRLFAYCYVNGMRIIQELCEILSHNKVRLMINLYKGNKYIFTVHDGYENWKVIGVAEVGFTHNKKWKYKLGCFFGGNNPAPHDITIKISKK